MAQLLIGIGAAIALFAVCTGCAFVMSKLTHVA